MTQTVAARPLPTRVLLAAAAVAAGVAHLPVTREHLEEAPYMGVAFVVFAVGCGGIALASLLRGGRLVSLAAVGWCGAALATYVATRLVPFPLLSDDVGNWAEPWGLVSILFEVLTIGVGLLALRRG
jgi:hypothetical protein